MRKNEMKHVLGVVFRFAFSFLFLDKAARAVENWRGRGHDKRIGMEGQRQ